MVLQLISGFAYNLVEQSWIMAIILVKYFLLIIGLKVVWEQKFEVDYISDQLIEYSGEVLTTVVLLGIVNMFAGFEIEPLFATFSQLTAFLYFAFLFWKY